MEVAELTRLMANYGMGAVCLAVLISLHIYNVRITLPKLAEQSQVQIDKLVVAFRDELAEERRQCHEDHTVLFNGTLKNQIMLERLSERLKVPGISDRDIKEAAQEMTSSNLATLRLSTPPQGNPAAKPA